MKRRIFSLCLGCALALSFAAATAAEKPVASGGVMNYVVVDLILPVMSEPGGKYAVTKDGDLDGENIEAVVVYGNHIKVKPVSQAKFKNSWVELPDPEGGGRLGYVPLSGLEPLASASIVDADGEATQYLVTRDAPLLTLQPGKTGKKYLLSSRGYELLTGEVVTAYGKLEAGGATWLMLGFGTSAEAGGDGGSGLRYAWIRAQDVKPLADYQADNSRADPALLPLKIRISPDVDTPYLPVNAAMREAITRQGFWMDPTPTSWKVIHVDDMADVYADTRDYAVDFLTTDIFLHAYHLIFDRMLQKLEMTCLAPALEKLLTRAVAELEKARGQISPEGENAYAVALDMFRVPLALLGKENVGLSDRASMEVGRILSAGGAAASAITGADTDYTQYRPRGHYTLTPEFEKYFRAVSFLGNVGLKLFVEGVPQMENIRAAALLTLVVEAIGDDWKNFEAPISFLVGNSDDVGPKALSGLASRPGGYGELDDRKIALLADEIQAKIRPSLVGVAGSGHEFRISGKAFTFDAYAFTSLTYPAVRERLLPEGTDVMAVLGSGAALEASAPNNRFASYQDNLKRLQNEAKDFIARDDTVYTKWLGILRDSFNDSGSKQFFYSSPAWKWKKLLTASAAWAELKHDTILYAEQSGAEMGAGGDWYAGQFAPPSPRGYVEPDPQTFDAIAGAIERMERFASEFSLEEEGLTYRVKLRRLKELCLTARGIAEREVSGSVVSDKDYEAIKSMTRSFDGNLLLPENMNWSMDENDEGPLKMALVADVATDSLTGEKILLVATGTPRTLYVFVNDMSGGPRIARGYVYSYYEFVRSFKERMTDGEWKKIVYNPARAEELRQLHPSWYEKLGME